MGVMIDKNLAFKRCIDNLVLKAQYKLHALRCIRNFSLQKILDNAFRDNQFNYATLTLIWVGFLGVRFVVVLVVRILAKIVPLLKVIV